MKMTLLLLTFALIIPVLSVPIGSEVDATIISYVYEMKDNGYFFSYSTSNGITREENGVLSADPNSPDENGQILRVNGFYSYKDNENNSHRVDYTSDENGYRILNEDRSIPGFQTKSFDLFGTSYGYDVQSSISTSALASLSG